MYKTTLQKMDQTSLNNMIVIDGVVGAGKSTLLNILESEGYTAFREPVIDNPILDKFYHDRERYAFLLQIFFLNKRFEHVKKAMCCNSAILDRSIYCDLIFAKMLYDNNEMSKDEFDTYKELLENMLQHLNPPKLIIYLELSVDEAIRRIQKRGRDYELIVEREYWEKINKEYNLYFNQYNYSPILKININNLDFENNEKDREYVLNLIKNKLKELGE